MSDILSDLFSSELFLPRGHSLLWKPSLVWLHLVSNALLAGAFVAAAVAVARAARRRRALPYPAVAALLAVSALTHLFDAWVIWRPLYWLDGVLRALGALAALAATIALAWRVPTVSRQGGEA